MIPSKSNRLLEYVRITDKDEMIAEYLDYLKFYSNYRIKAKLLFSRDNWRTIDLAGFRLYRTHNKQFIVELWRKYLWKDVLIASFVENYVNAQSVMSCDIYGKGLLLLNREDWRDDLETVFQFRGFQRVILTRIDYAVDCQRINWNKPCSLKSVNHRVEKKRGVPYYVVYGSKLTSPQFIRYYEKKKDLKENNAEWLYPDYAKYDKVMRYELQVNSDGIAKDYKEQPIENLRNIANFNHYVAREERNHHKLRYESEEYLTVEKIIKEMRNQWDWHNLVKIQNFLAHQILELWPIVESEEAKLKRETLELKREKQDQKIYWSALERLNVQIEN